MVDAKCNVAIARDWDLDDVPATSNCALDNDQLSARQSELSPLPSDHVDITSRGRDPCSIGTTRRICHVLHRVAVSRIGPLCLTVAAILFRVIPVMLVGGGTAYGTCDFARVVSSVFPRGSASYVHTPGIELSATTSTTSEDLTSYFWAMGHGHPQFNHGWDSGTFPAFRRDGKHWVRGTPGSPTFFHTTWAASSEIDGCIDDDEVAIKCTAVLLADQAEGRGFFAFLTVGETHGNYSFAQPGNAPIVLAPVPKPIILSTSAASSDARVLSLRIDPPAGGLYLAGEGCPSGAAIVGYRVYETRVGADDAPPTDHSRFASHWALATGGSHTDGSALNISESATITVGCDASEASFLATAIVFDSGFETSFVSEPTTAIDCEQ